MKVKINLYYIFDIITITITKKKTIIYPSINENTLKLIVYQNKKEINYLSTYN